MTWKKELTSNVNKPAGNDVKGAEGVISIGSGAGVHIQLLDRGVCILAKPIFIMVF